MTRRRILITGASSGLGAEMARQFAAAGRDLALCARRMDRLTELRSEILAAHPGHRVEIAELDVDDHDAVFRVVDELRSRLGGLDRVVVNAGLGKGAAIGTGRFEVNRQTITTNLVSALAQCEAALQAFRAQGDGHLVVVSSMSALRGMPGQAAAYSASKAGISSIAESLRIDVLGTPIRVTTLLPGYIESEMNDRSGRRPPFMAKTPVGVAAMIAAIEREPATAPVPTWPWRPVATLLRHAPLQVLRRLG